MNLVENIRLAFESLRVNRMRAFLTMLGIIIGISAVITITTIGSSLQATIAATMRQMGGTNMLSAYVEAITPEFSSTEEEENSEDIYVADVHQSLTLRNGPSSDSDEIASLTPMTHLRLIESVEDTDYALVEVQTGQYESYRGYVNSEYITPLGESTIRVGTEE